MPNFPLYKEEHWDDNGFHMSADAYLTEQGQLRADITTQSTSWGLGFTGGCTVVLIDANQNILYKWLTWPLGVDARSIWWKASKRTDHPEGSVDPTIAAQTDHLEIWLGRMGKDRWDDIINDVRKKFDDGLALFRHFEQEVEG